MGMFDWVRSSYPLPEPFMGLNQTKEIEDGYGGTMSHHWVDPAGYLWVGDYRNTSTFEVFDEGDPRYSPDKKWMNYEWLPTGEHGKFRILPLTKYVEIYPAEWGGSWADWPRLRLHFRDGKLQDFKEVTGR